MIRGIVKSALGIAFVVLFAVVAFAGPKAGADVASAGGTVAGGALGSMFVAVRSAPEGWRAVVNSGGSQSYVSNYPKLAQPKKPTAQQQLAKAKADLAKAKRDLAAAKKNQP